MRAFLTVVAVCLVVGVAAAWWFQWWSISTAPSDDGNKREVRLSVDQDKVKQDVAAARSSITGGGQKKDGSAGTEKAPARARPAEGTVRAVDLASRSFTVASQKDGEVTVRTDAATTIRVGDDEGTLADLQVGDRAAMTYGAGAEAGTAKTVTVTRRSSP